MKILTCLKEVPGRETRYDVNSDSKWIHENNVTFEANECDEYALEEALKLKETHGGEVVILTIGSERAEKVIRKGLAMGADRAVLVVDRQRQISSPHASAAILAEVARQEGFDLLLAGTQSDDYGFTQTGVLLAEMLGLPHATIVMEIKVEPEAGKLQALREMESGWFQWVEMPQPAVLMVQAGISAIRYASLKGIMQAKKKEIKTIELSDVAVDIGSLPAIEVRDIYLPEQGSKAEMLEGDTETVVASLIEKLRKEAKVL